MNDRDDGGFPNGFEAHRRAQRARIGADMTPAERLRWLEETMDALRRWQGRARSAGSGASTGASGSGKPPRR